MQRFTDAYSKRETPQAEPIPGEPQIPNAAGGWVYSVGPWEQMLRFLVLGTEGGTYYIGERTLTRENAANVEKCIAEDGRRAVDLIAQVSDSGRAPKNDPAIFALALAASSGAEATRRYALAALPRVCRIPTHLFHFVEYCKGLRGWGKGLRKAVGRWYGGFEPGRLAYLVAKYRQRDGWSNADLLAKAHVRATDADVPGTAPIRHAIYRWIDGSGFEARQLTDKAGTVVRTYPAIDQALLPPILPAFEEAQAMTDVKALCRLIREHGLTREMLPTEALARKEVWEALLEKMPMTAMLRNLGNMSKLELLVPLSAAAKTVCGRLADPERLAKARIHPLAVLTAMKVYQQGHGVRGGGEWVPVSQVVDALDAAFYLAFKSVEPTGKRLLLALDVSGSMGMATIAGSPLTPREAAAAMAMVTARTEKDYVVVGFSAPSGGGFGGMHGGGDSGLTGVALSPRQRLDDVIRACGAIPMGGTDCALPMLHAAREKLEVDAFVVYTDNETWAGHIHPSQALRQYRQKFVPSAKLVVVGMTATDFSIAPKDDGGCLDVVGFDTAAPGVIADFVRGSFGQGKKEGGDERD